MRGRRLTKSFKAFLRGRGGVASVEFAIILPFLMVTLFGMVEIGRLLFDYHAVGKSVRDATRFLARVPVNCPSTGPSSGPLANYIGSAADETTAKNLAMTATVDNPTSAGDYLLAYWTNPGTITTTVNCVANGGKFEGVYTGRAYIPLITMTANVPFGFLWGLAVLDRTGLTMTVSHNEAHVGT